MQIFIDTANRDLIKEWAATGIIDGVTTNPSTLSKEGQNSKEVLLDICRIVKGDVSIEVVEKEPEAVYKQALEIAQLAPNVVVKIPFAKEYLPVIARLAHEGIKLNITLIFSPVQVLLVAKLGVTYISPFVGRLEDVGGNGIGLVSDAMHIVHEYDLSSKILAASIRTVDHWNAVMAVGADVVTLPPAVLAESVVHPLTLKGIEKFDQDWALLNKKSLL
ncbi:fructose-6-phosphate aldolase [Candidatus Babeliales bacterium]|nr:fructose-6-phosphate aldolase [Candidatus Babeliales bacterium]